MPIEHRQRRLVDADDGQRPRVVGVGQRLADRHVGQARDGDDLARPRLLRGDAVQRVGDVQLGDVGALDRPVGATPGDRLAAMDRALAHAAQRQAPDVGATRRGS